MPDPLSPQTWPFSLDYLPQSAYLVGGGVRDALRKRPSSYLDLDFVLPAHPVEVASKIARHYKAGFVLLDAERQIARIVFEQATADFALQVGDSLEEDLHRRDFTVNAIAYNPHTGEILDPLQGCLDLHQGILRMIAPENLAADPLRLLRAYRQAAQLDFELDPDTQIEIRRLSPHLKEVAAERVRGELSYLLSTPRGTPFLKAAWMDGLFQDWLPATTAMDLAYLARMDEAVSGLSKTWPALAVQLHRPLSDRCRGNEALRRTLLATAKLIWLVGTSTPSPLPDLQRLKYSRSEIQLVTTLRKTLPQVSSTARVEQLSRRDLYFLFQTIGSAFPALIGLSLSVGTAEHALAPLITAWLDPNDPIAHPPVLISGKDLVAHLHLSPGPQLGQLLQALEMAQAEGKITTTSEALSLAQILLQTSCTP